MSECLYDKTGRKIEHGDVLKVFHFTGPRRKKYYMYKQVLGQAMLGRDNPAAYFKLGHLNLNDSDYYHERLDGRMLHGYEIVQSIDADFENRQRHTMEPSQDV